MTVIDAGGEFLAWGRLLGPDEPAPFAIENAGGRSPIVLICEHASRRIPRRLGDLGVGAEDLKRHIAWDIGALGVARLLSQRFDAPLLYQLYSRLVCDCNRKTTVPSFVPAVSEDVRVPGNEALDPAERSARIEEIYRPFHDSVAAFLDKRERDGTRVVVIAVHSFTPVFLGVTRPWHIGLLHDRYRDLAGAVLHGLRRSPDLIVGDNEPYAMSPESDFTLPHHAEDHGRPCLGFEWRQDLIRDAAGQREWADRVGAVLETSCRDLALIG